VTRNEKVNTALSVVAIIIAAATPFVAYFWLDPTLQAFKHRGKLQVSSSKDTAEFRRGLIKAIIENSDGFNPVQIKFDVEILNIGDLPAKDIQIVAQYASAAPKEASLKFEPLVQYDVVPRANQVFITVKRPLASQDKLKVTFLDNPSRISVSNEFGETSTIDTDLGWFYNPAQIKEENGKGLEK
jgi:hypothetical protein